MLIVWAPIDDGHKNVLHFGLLPALLKSWSPLTAYQLLVPVPLPPQLRTRGRCKRKHP